MRVLRFLLAQQLIIRSEHGERELTRQLRGVSLADCGEFSNTPSWQTLEPGFELAKRVFIQFNHLLLDPRLSGGIDLPGLLSR